MRPEPTARITIPLSRPNLGERELEAVRQVFESGWVAGQGPTGAALEARISADLNLPYAVACSNCTAGLHLTLQALGVGAGDDVLVSDYSFVATGHAVMFAGATPVFVDVEPETFNLEPKQLEKHLTPQTKAVIAVHAFGQMADMQAISAFCKEHNLLLIEDAACAYGAKDRNGHIPGELSDAVCFSFHARKSATGGEGGAVATAREDLADHIRSMVFFGAPSARERRDSGANMVPEFRRLGFNYKLSDIQAGIIRVQIERLPEMVQERRRLAAKYHSLLSHIKGLTVPSVPDGAEPAWQSYVVTLAAGVDRNAVILGMRKRGVECTIGTYAMHKQPIYGVNYSCPVSADLFKRHLAIPMFVGLTEEEQEKVALSLENVIKEVQ